MCKYMAGYVHLLSQMEIWFQCVRFSCTTQTSIASGMGFRSVDRKTLVNKMSGMGWPAFFILTSCILQA